MKKKLCMILIVGLLVLGILPAHDFIQLGLNVGYKPTLETILSQKDVEFNDYFKAEYFSFDPELKINLFFIDLDALASINIADNKDILIDTDISSDLFLKISFFRIYAGAGIKMPFRYDGTNWYLGEAIVGLDNAKTTFLNSNLTYRMGMGFDCNALEVTINYAVPSNGTLLDLDLSPDWYSGKFSIGLLFNLI